GYRHVESPSRLQRLGTAIEDSGHQVGHTGWNRRFLMLAGSGNQILLFQNLFAFTRKKSQGTDQLPSALLELLGKAGGTAGGAVEVRLKAIIHAKEQIHCADRLAGGDNMLHPSHLLQVESGGTGRKDAPIYSIGKCLLGG